MTELSPEDCMMCNGLINILSLHPVWHWHVYRNYPFFQRGSERVRKLYQVSKLTISGARTIVRWYEYNLNEDKYPWINFKRFVIALSNEGIADLKIMKILKSVFRYLEREKANKLFVRCDWFVPYKLE
jgi:hypothetical protein